MTNEPPTGDGEELVEDDLPGLDEPADSPPPSTPSSEPLPTLEAEPGSVPFEPVEGSQLNGLPITLNWKSNSEPTQWSSITTTS